MLGGGDRLFFPAFERMEAYGINSSGASTGTSHTGGTSPTFSSWANLGSTLSADYGGFIPIVQGNLADTTMINNTEVWQIGYNSTAMGEWVFGAATTEIIYGPYPPFPQLMYLPAGTQMQVRSEASGAPEAHDVGLYCLR
jgi:hypothetical protein